MLLRRWASLMTGADDVAELVALVDRLEALLERSALSELEVEVGGHDGHPAHAGGHRAAGRRGAAPGADGRRLPDAAAIEHGRPRRSGAHAIVAPLTGVFYRSPSPGAEPYVREGGPVNAGQVIGLIEAMKLFNEIKSDVTGTVRRIAAGDGDLVKARQTLIEVEPA